LPSFVFIGTCIAANVSAFRILWSKSAMAKRARSSAVETSPPIVGEPLARRPFDDASQHDVTVGRVDVLRARLLEERVVPKRLERLGHPGVVPRAVEVLPLGVVPDAREVSEELPRGDRLRLLRKRRTVVLDRRVEVEPSSLGELHRRDGRQRLRHRREAPHGPRAEGNEVLEIGESVALGPLELSVHDDGDREPGDVVRGHRRRDRRLDAAERVGGLRALLRGGARARRGEDEDPGEKLPASQDSECLLHGRPSVAARLWQSRLRPSSRKNRGEGTSSCRGRAARSGSAA
jgi:hypothetical protein